MNSNPSAIPMPPYCRRLTGATFKFYEGNVKAAIFPVRRTVRNQVCSDEMFYGC